jgi:hypothetical protein
MPQKGKQHADHQVLLALAGGATVEGAARKAGVSEKTVYRRLERPEFRQQLQALRADMVQRTAGALTAAATKSLRTLLELQKATHPAAVRLGAARSILELGLKFRETAELAERLAAVEAQLAATPQEPVR